MDPAGAGPALSTATLTAAAALPLSGRYGPMARQARAGLRAWAALAGAELRVADCGEDPGEAARLTLALASGCDVLFGPYGSGATRAVAAAFAGRPEVIWNHGGAAVQRTGARMVDVLAPAERYWADLASVWAGDRVPLDRVAVLHAPTGFGRAVAAGAVASLAAAGATPLLLSEFDERSAPMAARAAMEAGAVAVASCGRLEDDLALVRALGGRTAVAHVAAGVAEAHAMLGDLVLGAVGPVQWDPSRVPPVPLGPGAEYPAAQALAAGLIAQAALAAAGSRSPDAVWDAVRALRTTTFLGPFAVDHEGRQTAHAAILVRWMPTPEGPRRVPVGISG